MIKQVAGFNDYKINENGVIINKSGHIMRPALANNYPRVALEIYDKNGKLQHRYNRFVHRLVAETFIPNPDNLPFVLHNDNDTMHCHVSNLRWGTPEENIQQAYGDGRMDRSIVQKPKHVFEVYNEDRSEVINCKGIEGVADLLGFSVRTIRPGIIKSGKYKGYTIKNTHKKIIQPVKFINKEILPQYIE